VPKLHLTIGWLAVDRLAGDMTGQIYRALRERILSGDLAGGTRLPSSRQVSETLNCARSTVMSAYARLSAEGYLVAQTGSATRVAMLPPVAFPPPSSAPTTELRHSRPLCLRPGVPDLEAFPHRAWARCLAARARSLRLHDLGYDEPNGLLPLRSAILDHVRATRGVVADPDQVLIVPSSRAAMALLAKLYITEPGMSAWIEEPGYPVAGDVLHDAGAALIPVPVDDSGMNPSEDLPRPRIIYVTPSHQYPTGVTMSLSRRLTLIDSACRSGALIIEDDYDSEFLGGQSIASLQSIDRTGVVAYVGTFSKVLAPGLRAAYAILPRRLVGAASAQQALFGAFVPVHIQAALFDFLGEGHLRAHLRQMQGKYLRDGSSLDISLKRHCQGHVSIGNQTTGLQMSMWFTDPTTDDHAIARYLVERGFGPEALSTLYRSKPSPGLLIGIPGAEQRAEDFSIQLAEAIEWARNAATISNTSSTDHWSLE
jgi:GntR family transcriptional regulator/MocR family aminotransferase